MATMLVGVGVLGLRYNASHPDRAANDGRDPRASLAAPPLE